MQEKIVEIEDVTLDLKKDKNTWHLNMPKSQTRIKDIRQMNLLQEPSDYFAPLQIDENEDMLVFHLTVEDSYKNWEDILKLNTSEKLRLLCNVTKLERFLTTRITFSLHPETLLFDENLMPVITYRGLRNLVPPFELDESAFLKQLKCYIIALFSTKYDYEQLYNGSLKNAEETEFQRQVRDMEKLSQLKDFLLESYQKEQKKTEKTMSLVPLRKYRTFKQLSIIMIVVSILLAAPLAYYGFVKSPHQDNVIEAHGQYLSSDYGEVISILRSENPENLPFRTQYVLANSYINVEQLSEREKEVILRNVSLRSDTDYLLYWIYNGRGEFEESMEKAKYIDDAQLIMYGLIKQIEEAKNNPELSGTERDETVNELQDELKKYQDDYELIEEEAAEPDEENDEVDANSDSQEENSDEKEENKESEKDKK